MESFVEGTKKKKRERKRETRCLSGVLSMHSAEKLNLNRGGGRALGGTLDPRESTAVDVERVTIGSM